MRSRLAEGVVSGVCAEGLVGVLKGQPRLLDAREGEPGGGGGADLLSAPPR